MWLIGAMVSVALGAWIFFRDKLQNPETKIPTLAGLIAAGTVITIGLSYKLILTGADAAGFDMSVIWLLAICFFLALIWGAKKLKSESDRIEQANKDKLFAIHRSWNARKSRLPIQNSELSHTGALNRITSVEQYMEYFRIGAIAVHVDWNYIDDFLRAVSRYGSKSNQEFYWCSQHKDTWDALEVFRLEPLHNGCQQAEQRCMNTGNRGATFVCDYFDDGVVVYKNEVLYNMRTSDMHKYGITLVEFDDILKVRKHV